MMEITPHSSVAPRAVCLFPKSFDIQSLIFDFVGVDKDIATCRLVSKDWKGYVQSYLEVGLRMQRNAVDKLRPQWEELQRTTSDATKETIEIAEVRKVVYDSFDRNVFLRSMRILAKINKPSECTRDGVLAVMHLLTDEVELKNNGGALDWKFFKKKLLNRDFLKTLRTIQPEDISSDKVQRFEAFVGMEMVTEYNLMYASAEARDVYLWALNIIEYKEFLDTLTPEVKNTIAQFKVQKEKEKELEVFENVLKAIEGRR